jgi:class 3 adenylate cyclase
MTLENDRSNIVRIQKDIANLKSDLGKEVEKISRITKSIADLNAKLNRKQTQSSLNSVLNEISRKQKDEASHLNKISQIEKRISDKSKELDRYLTSANREEEKRLKKHNDETKKIMEIQRRNDSERLINLRKINFEIQKKNILERKIGGTGDKIESELFVLKADIKGYSKYMVDPEMREYIPENFENIVKINAVNSLYYNVSGGDSLVILDTDLQRLAKTAFRIIEDLSDLRTSPKIRIAIDFGLVTYLVTENHITKLKTGEPLRLSARLEPFVTPNEIWLTERAFEKIGEGNYSAEIITDQILNLPKVGEQYNIKKTDSPEDDILVRLYKLTKKT